MAAVFSVVYLAFIEYNSISATEQRDNKNKNNNNNDRQQAKAKRDEGSNAPKRSKRHFKELFRWNMEPGVYS